MSSNNNSNPRFMTLPQLGTNNNPNASDLYSMINDTNFNYANSNPTKSFDSNSAVTVYAANPIPSNSSTALSSFTSMLHEMIHHNELRSNRQDRINLANQQLHAMNFFLNYANAHKSKALTQEYQTVRKEIDVGRTMLAEMQTVIQSQESALTNLNDHVRTISGDVESQQAQYHELQSNLEVQRETLDQAMQDYSNKLQAQENLIKQQEQNIERLLSVRFRLDFGIDCLIVLLAWYCSHMKLMRNLSKFSILLFYPVSGLTSESRYLRNKKINNLLSLLQLAAFAVLIKKFRHVAVNNGIHNTVGNYSKYVQWIAGSAKNLITNNSNNSHLLQDTNSNSPRAAINEGEVTETPSRHKKFLSSVANSSGSLAKSLISGLSTFLSFGTPARLMDPNSEQFVLNSNANNANESSNNSSK
jgi:hypothetical protein